MGFPGGSDGKESAYNVGDLGLIPGLGRSPARGHGNPLQYSCLENPLGQRSLAGYGPWGWKELDMTEWLHTAHIYVYAYIYIKCNHHCCSPNIVLFSRHIVQFPFLPSDIWVAMRWALAVKHEQNVTCHCWTQNKELFATFRFSSLSDYEAQRWDLPQLKHRG